MKDRGQQSAAADPEQSRRIWYFGRAILDERSHELTVDGADVELERKPLEVLCYLLQHAGEVCTKEELLANVWPGRVLSETVLTKCIGRIREAIEDSTQEIVKTAYGFGYRLIAPVRVETAAARSAAHFEFRSGDHPVGRPLWSLIERLGGGGQGEAWRGRHDKTGEQRVFKFALNEGALATLKREITLFRVINDTLGSNARVVKLLDWNLEQAPYFVESEYVAGGSLLEWVKAQGGIPTIAVSDRLEMIARIADALGAVHSVGVLHKDLKPSNIFVRSATHAVPEIVLGDFGSGGILDADRLERLGITRLGFTKTLTALEGNSGTPLYLPPEVLAGQPFTVKSDLYALGIVLYQFLVGDFHKAMSPGWERGIDDELLREDIGLLTQGNPADRLGDAEAISRRLRTLESRRQQVIAQRLAQAKAEQTQRLLERARARRAGLALAFVALMLGLALSTTLYFRARRAQMAAVIAAEQSQAVKEFLSRDVFAPVSSQSEPVKDMTVIQLLTRAGNEIDTRFSSQPDVAAELHFVIGRSFQSFLETALETNHYRRALELGEHLSGPGSKAAARSASELVLVDYLVGQLNDTIGRYNSILVACRRSLGENAPEVLDLRLNLARGYYLLGAWSSAARMLGDLLRDTEADAGHPSELRGRAHYYYGQLLTDLAEPREAEQQLRMALDEFTGSLGENHVMVAETHSAIGLAMSEQGRFADATRELGVAHALAIQWAPPESWIELRPRLFTAIMLLHQDQPAKAEPLLADIVRYQDDTWAGYLAAHQGMLPALDRTGPVRQALGEAYERQGKLREAIETLQRAVTVSERISSSTHPQVMSAKLSLAEALIEDQRGDEARHLLTTLRDADLGALPPTHPIRAQFYRVNGLLDLADNGNVDARKDLTRALDVFQSAYGPKDWRVIRAHKDLQLASGTGVPQ